MREKIAGLEIPLFVLFPIAGFLSALYNLKSKANAFIYIAFAMLFGYAISFTDPSADSYRYAEAFARFDNTLGYEKIVKMYRNGELKDMYQLLLFYLTSILSNNPKVMYAFAGLVYGIFSYLNLRIFVKEKAKKNDIYTFILALVFFTYITVANVNGLKFWTGAMILFYATYNFIIKKKNIWVIGIIITPYIHYGFMLFAPLLVLYRFIHPMLYNNKGVNPFLLYMFIGSFAASWVLGTNSINLSFLAESDALSREVGDRMRYINSDETANLVESRAESSLFLGVQKYFVYAIKIYVFISVLFLNKLLKRMKGERKIEYTNLFAFILFFYSIAFVAMSFPSGGRFMNIAHLFLIVLIAKFYKIYREKNIRNIILLALPAFSFNIAFINGLLPIMILTPTFWYGNLLWILMEGVGFCIK